MNQPLALVIDDEPDICELLTLTLGRMDVESKSAIDVASAKMLLKKHRFDICLTDMRLPDGDGLDLVDWMQTHAPNVPVAVITAHGNVETAVQALKLGRVRLHIQAARPRQSAQHRCESPACQKPRKSEPEAPRRIAADA